MQGEKPAQKNTGLDQTWVQTLLLSSDLNHFTACVPDIASSQESRGGKPQVPQEPTQPRGCGSC